MCGLTGFLERDSRATEQADSLLHAMAGRLLHRGPDDGGVWSDVEAGIGLAHRRLAILDLTSAGHQPMMSRSGRFAIVFNGEIYNHLDMRKELVSGGRVSSWNGHSDTETLLAAIEAWGWETTLQRTVGMFAIALWDRQNRRLFLARDRIGEKPLYYGYQGDTFLFGSELKSIKVHPSFRGDVDRGSLSLFLRHGAVPAPYSIYRGVRKLPPGTWVYVSSDSEVTEPSPYWSLAQEAERGQSSLFVGSEEEAVTALEEHLTQAIQLQRVADVPLGALLSGGVDSSTIVAMMQAQSTRPVKTFTIGFQEGDYNEAEHANVVARYLRTEHTELYVTPRQALDVIPELPALYDEPFSDASQIPTYLVSQLARQHVTVALSGDGGDELFGGYNRHFELGRIWRNIIRLPVPARRALAKGITMLPPNGWSRIARVLSPVLPSRFDVSLPGEKLYKLAGILTDSGPNKSYLRLLSYWNDPAKVVIDGFEPPTLLTDSSSWPRVDSLEHRMMLLDMLVYLPDDILVKTDRASMGVSLESRIPLLDHRVVEFAWTLPLSLKIRGGQGKWVLRRLLDRYVPRNLIERPKAGFSVPIGQWLRGSLRDWAEELVSESRLKREGYFDTKSVRNKWDNHLAGRGNWQYHLWSILMFQAWLEAERELDSDACF